MIRWLILLALIAVPLVAQDRMPERQKAWICSSGPLSTCCTVAMASAVGRP